MPDGSESTALKIITSLSDIDARDWDACAGGDNPFISHAFLSALELSGSATAETGWAPHHLVIEGPNKKLAACAPLYLKNHSYGEYVFDWAWADALNRAGGRYYPKLQCAVPFSPVTGSRLLRHPECPDNLCQALIEGMVQLARTNNLSGIHVTFHQEGERSQLQEQGFLPRTGLQYHWLNRDYQTFDDFLSDLTSRKRKAIRKERQKVRESGIIFEALTGTDINESHWDCFYQFYLSTIDKKWGPAYLTRNFFSLLGQTMGDQCLLIMARDQDQYVGGALNLIGTDTLYGRYWGGIEAYKFLHFECCYYQAIDYAIQHGLQTVEAGAQGPHKVQRGYRPVITHSAHWLAHPGLKQAVNEFIRGEMMDIKAEKAYLDKHSPFRNESPLY